MDCFVTGGCGFIGSHLVEALLAEGHRVTAFDNLSSGREENLAAAQGKVRLVRGDIRDREQLAASMRGAEIVFHEAALVSVFESVDKPALNHEINVTGTFNVVDTARICGVRRLVFASTSAVYGNAPELPKRETMPPAPESPYALGKLAGEHYLRIYAGLYGLETVALRYFNVFGPRQDPGSLYSGVISRFAEVILAGQNPTVYGDGTQTRDFVYVDDVVKANLRAMAVDLTERGTVINIGSGRSTSHLDLLAALRQLTGRRFDVTFTAARSGDILHSLADVSRARQQLGYEPSFAIAEGLSALLEWHALKTDAERRRCRP